MQWSGSSAGLWELDTTSDPVKAHLNFGSPVKMKGLKKANVALQGDPTEGALFYLRRP